MINPYQTPALVPEPRSTARRIGHGALYVLIWSALGFGIPYLLRGAFRLATEAGIRWFPEADLEAYQWLPAALACMLVLGLSAGVRRYPHLGMGLFESILIVGGSMIASIVTLPFVLSALGFERQGRSYFDPSIHFLFSYQFAIWMGLLALLLGFMITVRLVARKS